MPKKALKKKKAYQRWVTAKIKACMVNDPDGRWIDADPTRHKDVLQT